MSKKKKVVGATVRATTRGLPAGGILNCTDNSGARLLKIITVKGLHTRLTRYPSATVGDMVICSVTKGTPKLRRQIVP
ncbi:MAG: uL14 family ribosomal protein, partial [Promethearchaeota archaeon]